MLKLHVYILINEIHITFVFVVQQRQINQNPANIITSKHLLINFILLNKLKYIYIY